MDGLADFNCQEDVLWDTERENSGTEYEFPTRSSCADKKLESVIISILITSLTATHGGGVYLLGMISCNYMETPPRVHSFIAVICPKEKRREGTLNEAAPGIHL